MATGGTGLQDCANRLVGSNGIIEVGGRNAPPLRVVSGTQEVDVDLSGMVSQRDATTVAVLDLVDAVKNGREPRTFGTQSTASNRIDLCNL